MPRSSIKRVKKRRKERKLRRKKSSKISPCGESSWKESVQTVGGVAGAGAGLMELILICIAL